MWSRKKKNCPHNTSRETGHEEENKWRLMAQTNCNNKYGHAAENTHSYIMNGDLGRTFAICNENRKHASEMPAMLWVWWHFTPLPPGAVCSADSHAASFLPHAGCAFSVLDDLCSCLGVIKAHLCALFFLEGKGNIFKLEKAREYGGIYWAYKACTSVQCASVYVWN